MILFKPGQVVATPGALEAMERNNIQSLDLLTRHLSGDWGEIPKEDGNRIWIITEWDRSVTTFLLPEEY